MKKACFAEWKQMKEMTKLIGISSVINYLTPTILSLTHNAGELLQEDLSISDPPYRDYKLIEIADFIEKSL